MWLSWLTARVKWMAVQCTLYAHTAHSLHVHIIILQLALLWQADKQTEKHGYLCWAVWTDLASHSRIKLLRPFYHNWPVIFLSLVFCVRCACICTHVFAIRLLSIASIITFIIRKLTYHSTSHILLHFNFRHWITQIEQFISYLSGWSTIYHFSFNALVEHA